MLEQYNAKTAEQRGLIYLRHAHDFFEGDESNRFSKTDAMAIASALAHYAVMHFFAAEKIDSARDAMGYSEKILGYEHYGVVLKHAEKLPGIMRELANNPAIGNLLSEAKAEASKKDAYQKLLTLKKDDLLEAHEIAQRFVDPSFVKLSEKLPKKIEDELSLALQGAGEQSGINNEAELKMFCDQLVFDEGFFQALAHLHKEA